ncbi:uncharacterized protein N7498_003176 [Penicillium cinerascens]|uniref:Uncharacterized protein n=1 Tax=Penicillium cinerascens TaxID=70096 RepID=A0A9W9N1S3_9EURO|nr:uncharacterized protein N7498_003176 [Penicillium cinerascens]KAJ5211530.1 hypothetical protein N7498_003176 [Penicillium cinerascens]
MNARHTYVQLCEALLDNFGQELTFNDMAYEVKQLNGAAEYMAQMRKAPVHIDNCMPFYVTMFHEFIHTVQNPEVEGTAGYGWRNGH